MINQTWYGTRIPLDVGHDLGVLPGMFNAYASLNQFKYELLVLNFVEKCV